MKTKLAMILPVMLLLSLSALAQGSRPMQPRTPEERAKGTVDYLAKNMTLTKEKQTAMVPLFVTFFNAMGEARKNSSTTAMETAEKNLGASLKKILTEPEAKEVKRLLDERKKQRDQYLKQQGQPAPKSTDAH